MKRSFVPFLFLVAVCLPCGTTTGTFINGVYYYEHDTLTQGYFEDDIDDVVLTSNVLTYNESDVGASETYVDCKSVAYQSFYYTRRGMFWIDFETKLTERDMGIYLWFFNETDPTQGIEVSAFRTGGEWVATGSIFQNNLKLSFAGEAYDNGSEKGVFIEVPVYVPADDMVPVAVFYRETPQAFTYFADYISPAELPPEPPAPEPLPEWTFWVVGVVVSVGIIAGIIVVYYNPPAGYCYKNPSSPRCKYLLRRQTR